MDQPGHGAAWWGRAVRAVVAACACVLGLVVVAQAQAADASERHASPSLLGSSAVTPRTPGYAWLVRRERTDKGDSWTLLAWPPSDTQAPRELKRPIEFATLDQVPEVVASDADRLYLGSRPAPMLGFPPSPSEAALGTEILRLRALGLGSVRDGATGEVGVLRQVVRSVPTGLVVRSTAPAAFAGGELAVLVEPDTAQPGDALQLLLLVDGAWRACPSPVAAWPGESELVGVPGGVGVVLRRRLSAGVEARALWIARVQLREQPGPLPRARPLMQRARLPVASWSLVELPADASAARMAVDNTSILVWSAVQQQGGKEAWALLAAMRDATDEGAWREVARVIGPSRAPAALFFPSEQRSMLIWEASAAGSPKDRATVLQYVAVSTQTGREVERGTLEPTRPVARDQIGAVLLVMGFLVALVGVMVFRPPAAAYSESLPPGVVLAEPLKRFLAGSLDITIALFGGGLVVGWATHEVFGVSVAAMVQTGEGQRLLAAILGVGIVHGVVGETLFGRTLGKLVVGIRVVAARQRDDEISPRSPRLLASILRNLVKWLVPPVALFALWSVGGRHRGELYSRTFVVEPGVPEGDDDPDDPA